jgi:NitT/TauT family transport system permease protein
MIQEVAVAILAILVTMGRVGFVMGISVVLGWFLGYAATRYRSFEGVYIPLIQIMESVPVIAFFPAVLIFFIGLIPGYLGVESAVDFLVFTAVAWNIWTGQYEALKTLPQSLDDAARMFRLSFTQRMRYMYIPATLPRVVANLFPSFASALFYITLSEVITVGDGEYSVFGIGTLLYQWGAEGELQYLWMGLLVIISAVVLVTYGILRPLVEWGSRFSVDPYLLTQQLPRRGRLRGRVGVGLGRSVRYVRRVMAREQEALSTFVKARVYALNQHVKFRYAVKYLRPMGITMALLLLAYIGYSVYTGGSGVINDIARNYPLYLAYLGLDWGRVALVTALSLVTAVPVGYLMVTHPRFERALLPVIEVAASVPVPAYLPLVAPPLVASLSFIGEGASLEVLVIIVSYLSTAWYVIYNFYVGVKTIPRPLWEIGQMYRLGLRDRLSKLVLPGAMPATVTGLASTVGSAWGGLQIAEFIQGLNGEVYQVKGLSALMSHYLASGNVPGLESLSILLGATVILLSIRGWRNLFSLARSRFRIEGAIVA